MEYANEQILLRRHGGLLEIRSEIRFEQLEYVQYANSVSYLNGKCNDYYSRGAIVLGTSAVRSTTKWNTKQKWIELHDAIQHYFRGPSTALNNKFSSRAKLAQSIVIVGSEHTDQFIEIFYFLREWEHVGGCHWICEEELFRHHIHQGIRLILASIQNHTQSDILFQLKSFILDQIKLAVRFTSNRMLHKRLEEMKVLLLNSLIEIQTRNLSTEMIENFFASFFEETPLAKFCGWFVTWAIQVLDSNSPSTAVKHFPASSNQSVATGDIGDKERQTSVPRKELTSIISTLSSQDIHISMDMDITTELYPPDALEMVTEINQNSLNSQMELNESLPTTTSTSSQSAMSSFLHPSNGLISSVENILRHIIS